MIAPTPVCTIIPSCLPRTRRMGWRYETRWLTLSNLDQYGVSPLRSSFPFVSCDTPTVTDCPGRRYLWLYRRIISTSLPDTVCVFWIKGSSPLTLSFSCCVSHKSSEGLFLRWRNRFQGKSGYKDVDDEFRGATKKRYFDCPQDPETVFRPEDLLVFLLYSHCYTTVDPTSVVYTKTDVLLRLT